MLLLLPWYGDSRFVLEGCLTSLLLLVLWCAERHLHYWMGQQQRKLGHNELPRDQAEKLQQLLEATKGKKADGVPRKPGGSSSRRSSQGAAAAAAAAAEDEGDDEEQE